MGGWVGGRVGGVRGEVEVCCIAEGRAGLRRLACCTTSSRGCQEEGVEGLVGLPSGGWHPVCMACVRQAVHHVLQPGSGALVPGHAAPRICTRLA